MDIPKNFFHDKIILLLATINAFLALLATVIVLLRFESNQAGGYFVQYRSNLGLNAYKAGSYVELLAFAAFALLIMFFHLFVSMRVYRIRRKLSVVMLGFGTLLLILTLVVSNALLVLAH